MHYPKLPSCLVPGGTLLKKNFFFLEWITEDLLKLFMGQIKQNHCPRDYQMDISPGKYLLIKNNRMKSRMHSSFPVVLITKSIWLCG